MAAAAALEVHDERRQEDGEDEEQYVGVQYLRGLVVGAGLVAGGAGPVGGARGAGGGGGGAASVAGVRAF